jgi:hypothetical protein
MQGACGVNKKSAFICAIRVIGVLKNKGIAREIPCRGRERNDGAHIHSHIRIFAHSQIIPHSRFSPLNLQLKSKKSILKQR